MIDFRYHLVSLVAVFLALAVGIVLGAGPLNDTLGHAIENQTKALTAQKRDLQSQVADLQNRLSYEQDVVTDLVSPTVFGRLTGTRVVVVVTPGTDGKLVASMVKVLVQSGAVVTGTVTLHDAYVDPDKSTVVQNLATHLAPAGVDISGDDAYAAAGFVLADALVTNESLLRGHPDSDSVALLSAFSQAGLLSYTGDVDRRADLALVVSPTAPGNPTDATDAANAALLPLLSSLDAAGKGSLTAGPEGSAASGGLVRAVRLDHDLRRDMSTVDVADESSGRIATVLGLLEQFQGGVGHYGDGPGATDTLPRLTPDGVASPSPSASASKSASKSAAKPAVSQATVSSSSS